MIRAYCFLSILGISSLSQALAASHEFAPALGLYTGDSLRSSVLGGLTYTYRHNESFWIGADFQGGESEVDHTNGLGIQSGNRLIITDATLSWNIPSLMGATRADTSRSYAADFYTSVGGGKAWFGNRSTPLGIIGGGLVLHFPIRYLAVRFDLKGLMFSLSNQDGSNFNADSLLSIGPSFIF